MSGGQATRTVCAVKFCYLHITSYIFFFSFFFASDFFLLDTGFTFLRNVHVLWVRAPLEIRNHDCVRTVADLKKETVSLS